MAKAHAAEEEEKGQEEKSETLNREESRRATRKAWNKVVDRTESRFIRKVRELARKARNGEDLGPSAEMSSEEEGVKHLKEQQREEWQKAAEEAWLLRTPAEDMIWWHKTVNEICRADKPWAPVALTMPRNFQERVDGNPEYWNTPNGVRLRESGLCAGASWRDDADPAPVPNQGGTRQRGFQGSHQKRRQIGEPSVGAAKKR